MARKKITILHSNDMHGDFLSELDKNDKKMIGGLALLSGYINKVRKEEKNVIFVIAGDMVQGSIIDTEYKGVSTIELMNFLAPDVVALGNHEFDYGLSHLLFLEKMANFPIVNANLYIKQYNKRLMDPYLILNIDGLDILFTGIITEKVMDSFAKEDLIGSFITLKEAEKEIEKITNAYKHADIDLTILLTHIGLESDKKLAALLKPETGVDMIIGGHSHSILKKPEKVNNILIAQAGVGTDQIGRFDIIVDDDTNSIVEYDWKLIPIDDTIAEPDEKLLKFIDSFKKEVDRKYSTILCKFSKKLTHPSRTQETTLGNLFADGFAEMSHCDVMFLASGSIRSKEMGPVVTLKDFITAFPYDDTITRFKISGAKLKKIFLHILRPENKDGEGECYQVNSTINAKYDPKEKMLTKLDFKGESVKPDKFYTVCFQGYHLNQAKDFFNISYEELKEGGEEKIVSTSAQEILEEYLRNNQNIKREIEDRLIY